MKKNLIILNLLLIMISIILTSCSNQTNNFQNNEKTSYEINNDYKNNLLINNQTKLKQIKSKKELKELLLREISNSYKSHFVGFTKETTTSTSLKLSKDSQIESISSASKNIDFSKTNNQVKGVDEADIVKTDGNYIYTISGNSVAIVKAYPPNQSKLVTKINYNNSNKKPINLFIYKEKLIVISNIYNKEYRVSEFNLIPYYYYEIQTLVEIYNIENKQNPKKIKEYKVSGSYYDARLINDEIMFISKKNIDVGEDINLPTIYKDGLKIAESTIYYFRLFPTSMYYTITLFSLNNLDKYYSESYILGSSSTLYVSENNIYLGYKKQIKEDPIDRFKEVIYPLINKNQREIFDKHIKRKDKEALKISFEQYFNNLKKEEQKNLIKKIEEKNQEYQEKINSELKKTIIHKLSIKNGTIFYIGKQEVEGYLLNQFSMDEYDGMLRVATTKSYWIRGEGVHMYNNVYVLDKKLNYIGWIERIAEDERIYATRFLKDKLYLVTYRQTDPLFIIDLSIPEQPKIQGKLKISGFSSYLHPYGDNFLIGIGKETKIVKNRTIPIGIKISLFDISSTSPKEISNYVINGSNLDSIVLREHKAFLFIPSRRLVVVPIEEYWYEKKEEKGGIYIFEITKNGIELKGKIKKPKTTKASKNYFDYSNRILRDLYIQDYLYAISKKNIQIINLNSLEEIKNIGLKYDGEKRKEIIIY